MSNRQYVIRLEARQIAKVQIRAATLEEAQHKAYRRYLRGELEWKSEPARIYQRANNQWTKRATHCSRGHAYTAANTIESPCSRHKSGIRRQCRTCKSISMKVRRQDLKEAKAELSEKIEPRFATPIVAPC